MSVLKCDYDRAIPRDFMARLTMLARVGRLRVEVVTVRRTRRGYHVTVTVRQRLAMMRIVAYQAALGSDWKRELFNTRRAVAWRTVSRYWRERANVLYARHYRRLGICKGSPGATGLTWRMGKCATS